MEYHLATQAFLSHIITTKHAALPLMIRRRRGGLIVEVTGRATSSWRVGTRCHADREARASRGLALNMASRTGSRTVWRVGDRDHAGRLPAARRQCSSDSGLSEANWRDAGEHDKNFLESESPLFVGRAVAATGLHDGRILERSGQLFAAPGNWDASMVLPTPTVPATGLGRSDRDRFLESPHFSGPNRVDEDRLRDPACMAESVDETNGAVSGTATASAPGAARTYSPMNDRRDRDGLSEEPLPLPRPRPKRTARSNRERNQRAGRLPSDKSQFLIRRVNTAPFSADCALLNQRPPPEYRFDVPEHGWYYRFYGNS